MRPRDHVPRESRLSQVLHKHNGRDNPDTTHAGRPAAQMRHPGPQAESGEPATWPRPWDVSLIGSIGHRASRPHLEAARGCGRAPQNAGRRRSPRRRFRVHCRGAAAESATGSTPPPTGADSRPSPLLSRPRRGRLCTGTQRPQAGPAHATLHHATPRPQHTPRHATPRHGPSTRHATPRHATARRPPERQPSPRVHSHGRALLRVMSRRADHGKAILHRTPDSGGDGRERWFRVREGTSRLG